MLFEVMLRVLLMFIFDFDFVVDVDVDVHAAVAVVVDVDGALLKNAASGTATAGCAAVAALEHTRQGP